MRARRAAISGTSDTSTARASPGSPDTRSKRTLVPRQRSPNSVPGASPASSIRNRSPSSVWTKPCRFAALNQIIVPSMNRSLFGARPARAHAPAGHWGGLDGDDALRLGTLRPVDRVELHLRALRERLEAIACDRGMVDEHVLPTISRGDEPIPLRIVEPLHGSGCHTNTSSATKERAEEAHTAQPVLAQESLDTVAPLQLEDLTVLDHHEPPRSSNGTEESRPGLPPRTERWSTSSCRLATPIFHRFLQDALETARQRTRSSARGLIHAGRSARRPLRHALPSRRSHTAPSAPRRPRSAGRARARPGTDARSRGPPHRPPSGPRRVRCSGRRCTRR